jgi:hypothetical protein
MSSEHQKVKDNNMELLDKLKLHDKFIVINQIFQIQIASERTICDTQLLCNKDHESNTNLQSSMVLYGIFRVPDGVERHAFTINVYMNTDSIMMQILDVPQNLWIRIDTLDNLDKFIDCYIDMKSSIKTDRYRLTIDVSPITIERMLLINRYLNQNIYGPTVQYDKLIGASNNNNTFGLANMYSRTLLQYDEGFELTTFTTLTGSTIGIKITHFGTFVHIIYPECGFFNNTIQHHNDYYLTGIATDVPLDVLLFLIQLFPHNLNQTVKNIKSNKLIHSDDIDTVWTLANIESSNNHNLLKILIELYNHVDELIEKLILTDHIDISDDMIDNEYNSLSSELSSDTTSDIKSLNESRTYIESQLHPEAEQMLLLETKRYICQRISIIVATRFTDRILTDEYKQESHDDILKILCDELCNENEYKYIDVSYTKFILSKIIDEWITHMIQIDRWIQPTKICTIKRNKVKPKESNIQ